MTLGAPLHSRSEDFLTFFMQMTFKLGTSRYFGTFMGFIEVNA